jgi:hypothetical protein
MRASRLLIVAYKRLHIFHLHVVRDSGTRNPGVCGLACGGIPRVDRHLHINIARYKSCFGWHDMSRATSWCNCTMVRPSERMIWNMGSTQETSTTSQVHLPGRKCSGAHGEVAAGVKLRERHVCPEPLSAKIRWCEDLVSCLSRTYTS